LSGLLVGVVVIHGSGDPVRGPAAPGDDQYRTVRLKAVCYVLERDFATVNEDRH
jgi:hypothetical protein